MAVEEAGAAAEEEEAEEEEEEEAGTEEGGLGRSQGLGSEWTAEAFLAKSSSKNLFVLL